MPATSRLASAHLSRLALGSRGGRIYRDAYGVPHVRATDVLDLARGPGVRHGARPRPGSWSTSAAGPPAPPPRCSARRCWPGTSGPGGPGSSTPPSGRSTASSEETRAFVTAYVEGVNAGLARATRPSSSRLGIEPAAVGAVDAARRLPRPAPALRQRARQAVAPAGPRRARRRRGAAVPRPGRTVSGSNAWAVGGARTASGHAADRRRPAPGLRVAGRLRPGAARLEDPDDAFDVFGFTFPGVPGVQHFAHAGEVAWAITNAVADYQDVYEESARRRRRRPRGDHRGPGRRPGDDRGPGDRARAALRGRPRARVGG